MTDWDDLRFFLAVARAGSLSAAARTLGVNHATVSRRLAAFEKRVGARLFDRLPGGWATTPAGEETRAAAQRVEEEMQALDRRVVGRDAELTGRLRVALSDAAAYALLPQLTAFCAAFPGIELELAASNQPTNLTRREADVAIRVTAAPPEHLVGRRVTTAAVALFASRAYLAARGEVRALDAHAWLGWDDSFFDLGSARWMREHVPAARIAARFDSVLLAFHAAKAGLGVALVPCILGDGDPDLARVEGGPLLPGLPLWLLTHADLRATARVRCFLDFMAEAIAGVRALSEGRRPQADGAPPPARARQARPGGRAARTRRTRPPSGV